MRYPEDVPVLVDGDVTLRAHTPADVEPSYEMCCDAEFQRWTGTPVPYLRSHAEAWVNQKLPAGWREGGFWGWAIDFGGKFAGGIDLRGGEGGTAGEVGFGLAPWARGNDVMTRAVRLVLRHAFDGFGWDVVIWRAFAGNWASRRVAWKCGFGPVTLVRGAGVQRDVRRDEWVATVARGNALEPRRPWWTVPVLESRRLRLRPYRPSDADRVVEGCSDPRTMEWLAGMPAPYTTVDALQFIDSHLDQAASGNKVSWAVADRDTDRLLGDIGIFDLSHRLDPGVAEIGYWAHPDARGRGVMTEAVGLVVRHAFTPLERGGLGRHRIVLKAAAANPASQHVARANGFALVGTAREADRRRDGGYRDLHTFDLLAGDAVS